MVYEAGTLRAYLTYRHAMNLGHTIVNFLLQHELPTLCMS